MNQSVTSIRRPLAHVSNEVLDELEEAAQARLMLARDNAAHLHEESSEADLIDTMREIQDALTWRDEVRAELSHRVIPIPAEDEA